MASQEQGLPLASLHDTHNQLLLHVAGRLGLAQAGNEQRWQGMTKPAQHAAHAAQVRAFMEKAFRQKPTPDDLEVVHTRHQQLGPLNISRLQYQSAPGVKVPALLYQRADQVGQQPGLLFLCGHENDGMYNARYQQVCQLLALQGLVVLCPEVAGQGERCIPGFRPTAAHDTAGLFAHARGQHLLGLLMRDAIRGLDVLSSLPGVDDKRLMVSGNSGGGLQSMALALLDPRVQAAAVGTFLSSQGAIFASGKAQDAEQVWPGSMTNDLAIDHGDLMAAMAPKPLLVLAAQGDFFPIAGLFDSIKTATQAYVALGAEDKLELYPQDTTHQYTMQMALAVGDFTRRHLGLGYVKPEIAPKALHWLDADPAVAQKAASPADWQANGLVLGDVSFAGDINLLRLQDSLAGFLDKPEPITLGAQTTWQGLCCQQVLYSAGGMKASAFLIKQPDEQKLQHCRMLLLPKGSKEAFAHLEAIRSFVSQGEAVLLADLPGQGTGQPAPINERPMLPQFGTLYFLNSHLLSTGQSLAGLRTAAVIQLAAWARETLKVPVSLYGLGREQIYAHYAAAFDPSLVVEDAPGIKPFDLAKQLLTDQAQQSLWPYVLPGIFEQID